MLWVPSWYMDWAGCTGVSAGKLNLHILEAKPEQMESVIRDRKSGKELMRFFRPLFGMITRSWHMYPLGVLFGLGFDTATEIGLLGISAAEASKGLPISSVLIFPALSQRACRSSTRRATYSCWELMAGPLKNPFENSTTT